MWSVTSVGGIGLEYRFAPRWAAQVEARYYYSTTSSTKLHDHAKDHQNALWKKWFDTVQTLHKNGQLKGVIIDLRSNSGGLMADFPYIVGTLVSHDVHLGSARYKRGVGRYDYSAEIKQVFNQCPYAHEAISEPIVILTNAQAAVEE